MIDRRLVQSAGVAGILFVVLIVLSAVITGNPPSGTDPTTKIVSYVVSNRGALLASAVLGTAGSMVILWWVGVLGYLLRAGDEQSPVGWIVLVSGAAASVVGAVSGLPLATLALVANQPGGLDNSSATRVLYELTNQANPLGFLLAMFLVALGVGLVQRNFAVPWLGWLSLALAVVNLVGGVLALTTTNSAAGVVGLVGLVGFGVIVLVVSIYMLRYRSTAVA